MEQPSVVVTPSPEGAVAATHEPGASLLTETCAIPEYTLLDLRSSAVFAPFVGCLNSRPDCCPSQAQSSGVTGFNDVYAKAPNFEQAVLERCPADYYSISASCCPSGYTPWTTDLRGQTPCFSVLQAAMTPPPITNANTVSSNDANPTVVISDIVYAIGYPVQVPINSFPSEAVAGTVATVLGLLAIAGLALFIYKRRQRREFLNPGNELNHLYGPEGMQDHTNTLRSGVHISGSSSFRDDKTIVEDGAFSRKSKESERSQQRYSPLNRHQTVVPPVNTPEQDSLQTTSIYELQSKQQGLNQRFTWRVEKPNQQAPQHEETHSHVDASEYELPTPSPFELDKPQLPAFRHQGVLNADDIVNVSNFGDETFASAHSSYDSGLLQGLTVETARPERLSRAYPKVVYVEQKDDGKSPSG